MKAMEPEQALVLVLLAKTKAGEEWQILVLVFPVQPEAELAEELGWVETGCSLAAWEEQTENSSWSTL